MPTMYVIMLSLFITLTSVMPATAGPVEINDGDDLTLITDKTVTTSATLISAANGNRAVLNCTNNDAAINVRWGGSTVTSTLGQRLKAGASISIRNTEAIYMAAESSSVTVSCTEEVR